MKHTPGPWDYGKDGYVQTIFNPTIGTIGYVIDDLQGQEANARLIAAAPDLLHLAEHVLAMADDAYLTGHPEWIEIVEEARAIKARC